MRDESDWIIIAEIEGGDELGISFEMYNVSLI